jgi:hypothetical protein
MKMWGEGELPSAECVHPPGYEKIEQTTWGYRLRCPWCGLSGSPTPTLEEAVSEFNRLAGRDGR